MKANPGGEIPPDQVIGRDRIIARLWRVLDRQSVVLTAERRMGKTSIVKKMQAEAPAGKLPVYRDLESVHTLLEFVESVFHDVDGYLSGRQRAATRARQWLTSLSGSEVGGMLKLPETAALHWKVLLTKILEDLVEHQDRVVILFWDELPMMLHNIRQREGEGAAEELLNTLRTLRQMHPGLRMVFTGSIGLHNVLTSLKRRGYANDPTNDMETVDVPPLAPDDAEALAASLFEGEAIAVEDRQVLAQEVAQAVDGMPFFIHRIVDSLAERGGVASLESVHQLVTEGLTDPQDRWHLRHYRERINTYYSPDERPAALAVLDVLATADTPLPVPELFDRMRGPKEMEQTRDLLALLQRDHYLAREPDGEYRFRFPLIRRWWRLERGL